MLSYVGHTFPVGHATTDRPKQERSPIRKPDPEPMDEGEAVPVVKWKARLPAESPSPSLSEPSEEDVVPARKWKVKQVPSHEENHLQPGEEVAAGGGSPRLSPQGRLARPTQRPVQQDTREEDDDEVPVVKWKARVPDDESSSDVPVVKWKAKVPQENSVPKRAKMPAEAPESDVPAKRRAKVPEDGAAPVVRRKARMPEEPQNSDVPVVKWKAKMPEEPQNPDVPVVKWKAKVPADDPQSSPPMGRRKPRVPENSQPSDVPVVKWKAKMPEDPQISSQTVVRKKAKMPEDDVPVVKWKAKMPQGEPSSDVPVVKWKASSPAGSTESLKMRHSPKELKRSLQNAKGLRAPRKVATMPSNGDATTSPAQHAAESVQLPPVSHSTPHQPTTPPSSPTFSPVVSASDLSSQSEPQVTKSLSRRSSFSESRSPSPPSISPQVRMAIASPILSRRTPSPSRGLAGSMGSLNSRQSPVASPSLQQKHLQYIGGGQQSPVMGRSLASASSPGSGGHISRIRTPRSPQPGMVKAGSPMKGLTPPGERKQKRMLPSGPFSAGKGQERGGRSNQSTPTSSNRGR